MFRVSDLMDLPILSLINNNSFKYTVKSLMLDGINNRVAAIVCKEGALKKSCKIIPYEKIVSIDANAIIVPNINCVEKINHKELGSYLQLEAVINKMVKSGSGDLYGVLTDIYINLLNGKITGYELSEGYIDDIVKGRRVIRISENLQNTVVNNDIILYQWLN